MRKKLTKEDIMNDDNLTPLEKYRKYIKTDDWSVIRLIVLERDNFTCRCCGRTSEDSKACLSVHHSTYDHLFNETEHLNDLITLCKFCHIGVHRVPSNRLRFKFT